MPQKSPNLIFVFADQWRGQAVGYAGDSNVRTPHIDAFAAQAVQVTQAVSGCPVCTPYRASLLTGQYPLTNGMFVNDQSIRGNPVSFAQAFNSAGYATAYIGKWHIDGHGRKAYVPPERRLGFQYWRGYECTHDYNNGPYYADAPEVHNWQGYDAADQTEAAISYLRGRQNQEAPFALFLSWGPPHNPYETAPEEFRRQYSAEHVRLRPNVPPAEAAQARTELAGYYAHIAALDACFGRLWGEVQAAGLASDTLVVLTSDHGDMLGSQSCWRKQVPYAESIDVPFLVRLPSQTAGRQLPLVIDAPDVMPTLLGLCDVPIPATVEGENLAGAMAGGLCPDRAALLACYRPFHEWSYAKGGREYRGVRTARYTYVRTREAPWLLFDNQNDPYQQRNLIGTPEGDRLQRQLEEKLRALLAQRGDAFESGPELIARYGIALDAQGDVLVTY